VVQFGGACSVTSDCPSGATCCDGSHESCDGTRLPSGDGANVGKFVVSADGLTVTDTITGLVWQRDGSGRRTGCSVPSGGNLTCLWAEAKAFCASLTLGGLTGWRLPGLTELYTIVDFTVSPAIDHTAFPSTPSERFWTSSPYAGVSYPVYAWYVDFNDAQSRHTLAGGYLYRVRCVR